jgi:hypothetical protein
MVTNFFGTNQVVTLSFKKKIHQLQPFRKNNGLTKKQK